MICRSCGRAYYRKNKQSICLSCYTNGQRRERIYYSPKEWKKFSYKIQEKLTAQYEIILRGELSARLERRAKIKRGFKLFNKYLDKGLGKLDDFSKATKTMRFDPSSNVDSITGGLNKASGVNKDFSVIIGKELKERKYKSVKYKWVKVKGKGDSFSDPYSALSSSKDPVI